MAIELSARPPLPSGGRASFVPALRAGSGPPEPAHVRALSLVIADGNEAPFRLELASIELYAGARAVQHAPETVPGPDPEPMRLAIRLALDAVASGRGGPFGAVVTRGGRVIATGQNRVTSTPDPTAHAEIVALRSAALTLGTHELTGCELYASCEPCPMCLGAAHWARVDRIWFGATRDDAAAAGFDDALLYEELARPREERRLPVAQVLREEALAAFRAWLADPQRRAY